MNANLVQALRAKRMRDLGRVTVKEGWRSQEILVLTAGIPRHIAKQNSAIAVTGDFTFALKDAVITENSEVELMHINSIPRPLYQYKSWDAIARIVAGDKKMYILRSGTIEYVEGDETGELLYSRVATPDCNNAEFLQPPERNYIVAVDVEKKNGVPFYTGAHVLDCDHFRAPYDTYIAEFDTLGPPIAKACSLTHTKSVFPSLDSGRIILRAANSFQYDGKKRLVTVGNFDDTAYYGYIEFTSPDDIFLVTRNRTKLVDKRVENPREYFRLFQLSLEE